jgi:hypothetical protein
MLTVFFIIFLFNFSMIEFHSLVFESSSIFFLVLKVLFINIILICIIPLSIFYNVMCFREIFEDYINNIYIRYICLYAMCAVILIVYASVYYYLIYAFVFPELKDSYFISNETGSMDDFELNLSSKKPKPKPQPPSLPS